MDEFRSREGLIQVVDHSERVVASYSTLGEWWADWVGALTAADPEVFVIYDSMMLPPHLAPRLPQAVHQVATMHMSHVYHPRRWNSPQHPPARRTLEHLDRFGAYIILTERQREDVETAYGHRSNLFVLPNPGRPVDPPSPVPARDPNLFVVIARLERVKRVDDAIRAFATVSAQAPRARLDIYGEGRQRAACQALIDELGLGDCVRLLGHQPQARDRLWEASGLLVTSRSEGFPLVILEALARGCPVVSYDIKYGPREQIEDGVTGFLAPSGDHVALATQCLRLLSSPDLVSRMGDAGQAHVRRDHDQYVGKWANILSACVDAAPRQTRVRDIELVVNKIGWGAAGKSRRVAPGSSCHRFSRNPSGGCGPLGHATLRCRDRARGGGRRDRGCRTPPDQRCRPRRRCFPPWLHLQPRPGLGQGVEWSCGASAAAAVHVAELLLGDRRTPRRTIRARTRAVLPRRRRSATASASPDSSTSSRAHPEKARRMSGT